MAPKFSRKKMKTDSESQSSVTVLLRHEGDGDEAALGRLELFGLATRRSGAGPSEPRIRLEFYLWKRGRRVGSGGAATIAGTIRRIKQTIGCIDMCCRIVPDFH